MRLNDELSVMIKGFLEIKVYPLYLNTFYD